MILPKKDKNKEIGSLEVEFTWWKDEEGCETTEGLKEAEELIIGEL